MPTKRRVRTSAWCVTLGAITGLIGCSAGDQGPVEGRRQPVAAGSIQKAVAQLKAAHPSANARVQGSRLRRVYGVVATGSSPDAAAERFRRSSAAAFGVDPGDLAPANGRRTAKSRVTGQLSSPTTAAAAGIGLMYDPDTGSHKFRLYSYEQQLDGIPVFRAGLRTLVRQDAENPVVWANTDLRPMGGFRPPATARTPSADADKALQALRKSPALAGQRIPAPRALARFSTPTPTIFAGVGDQVMPPRMAVKYTAEAATGPGKWTFVADAETGDVLHVESELHFNIDGSVEAEVVAGVEAMECGTLAVEPLAHARVTSTAGDAIADETGAFTIEESGSGSVTVTSTITGRYFTVNDVSENPASLSLNVTPPGPANFLHEDTANPPELVLAQLNAYHHANAIRDMLVSYVPEYPVISEELGFQVNVNDTGESFRDLCATTGGAWYDGDRYPASINFCQRTAERTNTAMGSIVHHEYGHHIIDVVGSGQAEYGEGMSDTIAMLFTKDPRIGIGYRLDCSEAMRLADRDCQYSETECSSCGTGLYDCGAVLSGTIWDIWQQLEITEPGRADDIIRSLVFSSIPMHSGTSIDPTLAIDLLTLDDDDGLLENGTPHYDEICTGFQLHGMDCPPLMDGLVVQGDAFEAEGPSDGPFEPGSVSYNLHNLGPQENLAYSVAIPSGASWLTVDSPSGTIPLGEWVTVTVSIDQAGAALLPDGRYSATIDFVNETSGVGTASREASLRVGVPDPIYTASFADGLEGFTIGDEPDNIWHQSTACVDGLPGHSSPGSLYYGIDDNCSHSTSVPDRHTITSPVIEVANPAVVDLGFNYYLRTEGSGSDYVEVLMSVNGGPFQIVASNIGTGEPLSETTTWRELRFEVSDLMPSSGPVDIQLQLAFDAGSPGDNNRTGFVIDDITVYAQPGTPTGGVTVPARIEAEDYVRYNDTTAGNQGGGCDTGDDVDKEVTGDSAGGGCNVGWTDVGEWLEYDITVPTAQTFDIVSRVASNSTGKRFRIEIDGVDVSGALTVPANGWQSYRDVVVEDISLSAGDHVVRLYMITNYINVNYIEFLPAGVQPSCGDGTCGASEDCSSCPQDCGACPGGCTCPSGCDTVVSASVPFVSEGPTNTCYFFGGSAGGYVNSWNMVGVNLNGLDISNRWIGSGSYPAAVDGGYYLYVRGDYPWSHVEVR